MNTIRFIKADELYHIRTLFSIDRRSVGVELSEADVDAMIQRLTLRMAEGTVHIPIVFDDAGTPLGMYVGFEVPKIGGWWVGLTKVLEPANHFNQNAPVIAPALNSLISLMEEKGYYKFWMAAPEKHHNIRNRIMRRHSNMLDRYDWFDEDVIPRGQLSNVEAFNMHRAMCNWSDITVRMFVLRQQHRIEIFKQQGHQDYNGTLIKPVE